MSWTLDGWKTYLVAAALIVHAASGLYTGRMDQAAAVALILEALAVMGLRRALHVMQRDP